MNDGQIVGGVRVRLQRQPQFLGGRVQDRVIMRPQPITVNDAGMAIGDLLWFLGQSFGLGYRTLHEEAPTEPWISGYPTKELIQGQVNFLLSLLSVFPSLGSGLDRLELSILDG